MSAATHLARESTAEVTPDAPDAPEVDRRYVLRVDRTTIVLVAFGLVLLIAVAVLATLLLSGATNGTAGTGTRAPGNDAPAGPTVALRGPDVAAYIVKNYGDTGVTCPTVPTAVGANFLCSDPSGGRFTVTIINSGGAYTVRPN